MLHQLEQYAIKRRRMNKGYQATACTYARVLVNESRSFVFQVRERGTYVFNLDGDVMHSRSAFG